MPGDADLVAVGHLRDEKDPATLYRAARLLAGDAVVPTIAHVGGPLDARLADEARATMAACPSYRWLGALSHAAARRTIARARALVHCSRIEGGANVVIEAVRSGVPVLASRIDGNVGLLGADYDGYFPVGDAAALAALIAPLPRRRSVRRSPARASAPRASRCSGRAPSAARCVPWSPGSSGARTARAERIAPGSPLRSDPHETARLPASRSTRPRFA